MCRQDLKDGSSMFRKEIVDFVYLKHEIYCEASSVVYGLHALVKAGAESVSFFRVCNARRARMAVPGLRGALCSGKKMKFSQMLVKF